MEKSKRCNYTYSALKNIFLAGVSTMADDKQITIEEAKTSLLIAYKILGVCEIDRKAAKKMLKVGKKAMGE